MSWDPVRGSDPSWPGSGPGEWVVDPNPPPAPAFPVTPVVAQRADFGPSPVPRTPRRRTRMVAFAAGVVVVAAVVAVVVPLRARHGSRDDPSLAFVRSVDSSVSLWVQTSPFDVVNVISSGQRGACPAVPLINGPDVRVRAALLQALPGFRARSVVKTLDQAAQMCMLQVSVQNAAGAIVLLRVSPPWDATTPAIAVRVRSGAVVTGSTSVRYVDVRTGRGWSVLVGWLASRGAEPVSGGLLRLAEDEARHW